MISFTRPVGQETNNPEGVPSYTMYAITVLEGWPLNAQYSVASTTPASLITMLTSRLATLGYPDRKFDMQARSLKAAKYQYI